MAKIQKENPDYIKVGFISVNINGKTTLEKYSRRRLKNKKTKKEIKPINQFFEKIIPGKGVISKNLEKEAVKNATEKSYRQTAKDIDKKLSYETIRKTIIQYKGKANKIPTTNKEKNGKEIKPAKLKNPKNQQETYKETKSGFFGNIKKYFQKIKKRIYIMLDGVMIPMQDGTYRECKVGTVLEQTEEKIYEKSVFCTWNRVNKFREKIEKAILNIALSIEEKYKIFMISDGADWIKKSINKIPFLNNKKTEFRLDWHHLQDKVLKIGIKFKFEKEDPEIQEIISFLWKGKIREAIKSLNKLKYSDESEEKQKQKESLNEFIGYLNNQQAGIVNYEEMRKKGYIIASGYVEKLNDNLIKKRMVNNKRIKWGKEGGESMMQILAVKMNGRFDELFL